MTEDTPEKSEDVQVNEAFDADEMAKILIGSVNFKIKGQSVTYINIFKAIDYCKNHFIEKMIIDATKPRQPAAVALTDEEVAAIKETNKKEALE